MLSTTSTSFKDFESFWPTLTLENKSADTYWNIITSVKVPILLLSTSVLFRKLHQENRYVIVERTSFEEGFNQTLRTVKYGSHSFSSNY